MHQKIKSRSSDLTEIIHFVAPQDTPVTPTNPCVPSPCGQNAQCQDRNGIPSCSCLPNYYGSPPNCRPECTINPDCPSNKACIRNKCQDPCPGVCGQNAHCNVFNHNPVCSCFDGYTGDPFSSCRPIPPPTPRNSIMTKLKCSLPNNTNDINFRTRRYST